MSIGWDAELQRNLSSVTLCILCINIALTTSEIRVLSCEMSNAFKTLSSCWGRTHRKTISDWFTMCWLSSVTTIFWPNRLLNAVDLASDRLVTYTWWMIWLGSSCVRRPVAIADAIVPHPMNPTVFPWDSFSCWWLEEVDMVNDDDDNMSMLLVGVELGVVLVLVLVLDEEEMDAAVVGVRNG